MTDDLEQVKNQIKMYYHCGQCLKEKPADKSPQEWCATEVGATKKGIQVWCKRHDSNVLHMDLEGYKHPAWTHRLPPPDELAKIKARPPLTEEQKREFDEAQFEGRMMRMHHTFQSMMATATEEFACALPALVAHWMLFLGHDKLPEGKKEFADFSKEVLQCMLEQLKQENKDGKVSAT
jgi:hypothetical protein